MKISAFETNQLDELMEFLDENLNEMYEGNCWGVPSFRISDENYENPFYQWGQDRLWLIEEEIKKRLD